MTIEESTRLPEKHLGHPLVKQFAAYWDDHNAAATASGLIHFGYGQFRRARVISKIDVLKEIHQRGNQPNLQGEIHEFALEGVVDAVRICICFENYMKAKLLADGFIIHQLDRGLDCIKSLAMQQRNRPIRLMEVQGSCGGWQQTPEGFGYLRGVGKRAVKMSWLLQGEYRALIGLPPQIAAYLDDLVEKRNNLHFYVEDGFTASMEVLQSLDDMVGFVRRVMVPMHNTLIREYSLPERFLISPNCA